MIHRMKSRRHRLLILLSGTTLALDVTATTFTAKSAKDAK